MKRIATKYVAMNPRRCVACWECVEKCPKHVIGKVGFLWHKHVVFTNADACIGCNKCIKVCPNGVFFKPDEADSVHRKNTGISICMERLLPWAFIVSAVTGISLHVAGHGTDHEVWHSWSVAHVVTSFLWLVSAGFHAKRHWGWYKTLISRGIEKKNRIALALSVLFSLVAVTGIILLVYVNGANSSVGLWHYKLGLLLLIVSLLHAAHRR